MARGVLLGRRLQQLYAPYLAVQPVPTTEDILSMLDGVNGLVFDASDKANLFQASDGTTPVTAVADPVAFNTDLLSGYNIAQSNGSLRPSYREPDGFGCIQFDGINDCLGLTAGGGISAFKNVGYTTIVIAAKPSSSVAGGRMLHIAINTIGSSRMSVDKSSADKLILNGRRLDADTNRTLASAADIDGAWGVFTAEYDFVDAVMKQQINMAEAETSSPAWGAGSATSNTDSHSIVMGASRNDNGTTPFPGYICAVAALPVELDVSDRNSLIRWAAGLANVSL